MVPRHLLWVALILVELLRCGEAKKQAGWETRAAARVRALEMKALLEEEVSSGVQ